MRVTSLRHIPHNKSIQSLCHPILLRRSNQESTSIDINLVQSRSSTISLRYLLCTKTYNFSRMGADSFSIADVAVILLIGPSIFLSSSISPESPEFSSISLRSLWTVVYRATNILQLLKFKSNPDALELRNSGNCSESPAL